MAWGRSLLATHSTLMMVSLLALAAADGAAPTAASNGQFTPAAPTAEPVHSPTAAPPSGSAVNAASAAASIGATRSGSNATASDSQPPLAHTAGPPPPASLFSAAFEKGAEHTLLLVGPTVAQVSTQQELATFSLQLPF